MADLYLVAIGREPFAWGSASLDVDGSVRTAYIAALVKAASSSELLRPDSVRPRPGGHLTSFSPVAWFH